MLCAQQILLFYCDFVLSSWARSFLWALLPLLHHPSMAAQLMSEKQPWFHIEQCSTFCRRSPGFRTVGRRNLYQSAFQTRNRPRRLGAWITLFMPLYLRASLGRGYRVVYPDFPLMGGICETTQARAAGGR